MYSGKTSINTSRLRRYKLRRRAAAVAKDWPGKRYHARRQVSAGGRPAGRCDFGGRASRWQSALNAGLASARRARPALSAAEAGVCREILRGAVFGIVTSLVLVWLIGSSPLGFVAAVLWSSCLGALIGILLWIGSSGAPDDPVLPPSPEQLRDDKPGKPSRRR